MGILNDNNVDFTTKRSILLAVLIFKMLYSLSSIFVRWSLFIQKRIFIVKQEVKIKLSGSTKMEVESREQNVFF